MPYYTYRNGGVAYTHTNFTSEWFRNCICVLPSAAEISLQMSRAWDFKACEHPLISLCAPKQLRRVIEIDFALDSIIPILPWPYNTHHDFCGNKPSVVKYQDGLFNDTANHSWDIAVLGRQISHQIISLDKAIDAYQTNNTPTQNIVEGRIETVPGACPLSILLYQLLKANTSWLMKIHGPTCAVVGR